jgi:hypothetical protein
MLKRAVFTIYFGFAVLVLLYFIALGIAHR